MQSGRKLSQRERIIAGMIAAANRDGHAGATVSAVIEHAGVSRPTFYDYFKDRDACFLAALSHTHTLLNDRTTTAVHAAAPQDATGAALAALIDLARTDPAATAFLTNAPLAAGTPALDARDQQIHEAARTVEKRERGLPGDVETPDMPTVILLGAAHRLIGSRLRRGDPSLTALHGELLDWAARYRRPRSRQRWRDPGPGAPPATPQPPDKAGAPAAPPGATRAERLTGEQLAVNQRQRILQAVARLADTRGYDTTTVADIAKEAAVDTKVFYRQFSDKQDAFMGYHEQAFQKLMEVMAHAFFAADSWPERSWHAGLAFLTLLQRDPLLAHTGFVEAYAVGPQAIQRVEDSHIALTIFLQEGYRHTDGRPPPGRSELEAIVAATFEAVYRQLRRGSARQLPRMLGLIESFVLTPFLGPENTNGFIDSQLETPRAGARRQRTAP